MIRHIFILDRDGKALYSKCFHHKCVLNDVNEFEKHELYNYLREFIVDKLKSQVRAISFKDLKFVVETRGNIAVFMEVDKNDNEETYREAIDKIADEAERIAEKKGGKPKKETLKELKINLRKPGSI